MNWTELTNLELELIDPIFFAMMEGELPALQSLRLGPILSCSRPRENFTNFVTQLQPLSRLSLHGHTAQVNLTQMLDRHGGTLRSLQIREWESKNTPKPVLSPQNLKEVNQKCPMLSNLGLDLNRNGTWPFDMLDSLAAYKSLSSLEIFFESEVAYQRDIDAYDDELSRRNQDIQYREPILNTTSSLQLFKRLRSLKEGADLLQLRLSVGDVGREHSYEMYSDWSDRLTKTYECSVYDSDGRRKEEGVAWCELVAESQSTYHDYHDLELTE